jgi:hypothetical protein
VKVQSLDGPHLLHIWGVGLRRAALTHPPKRQFGTQMGRTVCGHPPVPCCSWVLDGLQETGGLGWHQFAKRFMYCQGMGLRWQFNLSFDRVAGIAHVFGIAFRCHRDWVMESCKVCMPPCSPCLSFTHPKICDTYHDFEIQDAIDRNIWKHHETHMALKKGGADNRLFDLVFWM